MYYKVENFDFDVDFAIENLLNIVDLYEADCWYWNGGFGWFFDYGDEEGDCSGSFFEGNYEHFWLVDNLVSFFVYYTQSLSTSYHSQTNKSEICSQLHISNFTTKI